MIEFRPLLSTYGEWRNPVDILVLGDSFANLRPHHQWQNWLAARTGWRIHTLDKHFIDIDQLVSSNIYKKHPPRIVIWNNIERDMKDEYSQIEGPCTKIQHFSIDKLLIQPTTSKLPIKPHYRPSSISELNIGFPRIWAIRSLTRNVSIDTSETSIVKLSRNDLFSNRFPSTTLIYNRDFTRSRWKSTDIDRIRCGYLNLARKFESNRLTRFVTAIAPDKSSIYLPYIKYQGIPTSHLSGILGLFPVPDARLDIALSKAIASGARDVYMPNDTHWGTRGHRLAADAVLELLVNEGLAE